MLGDSSNKKPTAAPITVKQSKQWGIPGALFFGALAFLLPDLILTTIVGSLTLLPLTANEKNFAVIVLYELIIIGGIALVVAAYGKGPAALGLGVFKLDYIWRAALGFGVYLLLSVIISTIASSTFQYDQDQVQPLGFTNPIGFELLLIFVGLVVLVPFTEELLFRGFLFAGFRKRLSFVWASLLVSVLFALVHGQVNVGLDVFALSLVLCYLREKTNSLWPAILLHATKNGIAFVALMDSGFTG